MFYITFTLDEHKLMEQESWCRFSVKIKIRSRPFLFELKPSDWPPKDFNVFLVIKITSTTCLVYLTESSVTSYRITRQTHQDPTI